MDMLTLFPEYSIRTALNTASAEHALVMVNANAVAEWDTSDTHAITLPMIGSPALGMKISPISGSIVRMAASSLEM
jgi:hypothetical protein